MITLDIYSHPIQWQSLLPPAFDKEDKYNIFPINGPGAESVAAIEKQAEFLNTDPAHLIYFASREQCLYQLITSLSTEKQGFIIDASMPPWLIGLAKKLSENAEIISLGSMSDWLKEDHQKYNQVSYTLILSQLNPENCQAVSLKKLFQKCEKYGLRLILDASHALGRIALPEMMPENSFLLCDPVFSGAPSALCAMSYHCKQPEIQQQINLLHELEKEILLKNTGSALRTLPDLQKINTNFQNFKSKAVQFKKQFEDIILKSNIKGEFGRISEQQAFSFCFYSGDIRLKRLSEKLFVQGVITGKMDKTGFSSPPPENEQIYGLRFSISPHLDEKALKDCQSYIYNSIHVL